MVALFRLVTELGLYGSYWAVILPTAASAFGLFLARQFILAIPRDLIEAARIDGAGTSASSPGSCCRCPSRSSRCCSS